jgi:hypothetical protein
MITAGELVAAIERHTGRQGRKNGAHVRLLCPAHDDHHPSLDVGAGPDGKALVKCRSQSCSYEQILAALGLDPDDAGDDWTPRGPAIARYPYVDELGNLLYEVCRTTDKQFPIRRPDSSSKSGWRWKLGSTRLVLYRLPEVLAAAAAGERAIWIVEGEKHADLLHRRGRIATTAPMGAGKWNQPAYADTIAGAARVIVLADDDTPGRKHAEQVARSLHGRVGELKVVELFTRGESKRDVVDFYNDAETPEQADRALIELVLAHPVYTPAPGDAGAGGHLRATPLIAVGMRSILWFERPLWQRAAFVLLAGQKGSGKGTYLAGLAAHFTRQGMSVLFVSSEDSTEIDLKPRLVAAGAVIERCFVIQQHVRLPEDVAELKTIATRLDGVGLLVIDPVANHIGDRDSNSDASVRDAIAPLNQLADELDCLLIGVRHPGKDRSRGALASILGSTAWVDTPRAVVMIAVDDEDDQVRHIQVVAGNRSRNGAAQAFRIEAVEVAGLAEPITLAVALGESTKSVDDLLSADRRTESSAPSKTAEARERILDLLESEGDQESDELDARVARETGLSARTVRNARKDLADEGLVKAYPERDEYGSIERWKVGRTAAPR